jgi:hypothetical protein
MRKTTLQEVRNKIPISEQSELFLSPTYLQLLGVVKSEDYWLKESNDRVQPLNVSEDHFIPA